MLVLSQNDVGVGQSAPTQQFVGYIMDEVDSMSFSRQLEEREQASYCSQDTACTNTLDFPKDMDLGQADITAR